MDIQIRYGTPATVDEFNEILELDKLTYGEDIITNYDFTVARFEKCHDCVIRAYDGEKFIGAITMYPISDDLFWKIENSNHFFDDDITPEDIVPLVKNKNNNLFLIDIIVKPEYRGKGLSYVMFDAAKQFAKDKSKNGFLIPRIYMYALTDAGRASIKKNNGVFVKDVDDGKAQLFYFQV